MISDTEEDDLIIENRDLHHELTTLKNVSSLQQQKLEGTTKAMNELERQLQIVVEENNALRIRLHAVALVIRP